MLLRYSPKSFIWGREHDVLHDHKLRIFSKSSLNQRVNSLYMSMLVELPNFNLFNEVSRKNIQLGSRLELFPSFPSDVFKPRLNLLPVNNLAIYFLSVGLVKVFRQVWHQSFLLYDLRMESAVFDQNQLISLGKCWSCEDVGVFSPSIMAYLSVIHW